MILIGLNPIMGSDLIYGQNDSFVLAWLVLSLWLWFRWRRMRRAELALGFRGGFRTRLCQQAHRVVFGALLPVADCRG